MLNFRLDLQMFGNVIANDTSESDAGTDNPSLWRVFINSFMAAVNGITDTGEASNIVATDSSGNIVATGGLTAGGVTTITKTDANAFVVEKAGGTDVFNVDTTNSIAKMNSLRIVRPRLDVDLGAFTVGQTKSTVALPGFGAVGGFILSIRAYGTYHANKVYIGTYFDSGDYNLSAALASSGYSGTSVAAVLNSDGTIDVTVSGNVVTNCYVNLHQI